MKYIDKENFTTMTNTANLISRINSFDVNYGMSDDHSFWTRMDKEDRAINNELRECSAKELREIYNALNDYLIGSYWMAIEYIAENMESEKVETSFRSKVMAGAHSLYSTGLFETFGTALSASWKRYKLINTLKNGIAYFEYAKATGEVRKAIGTLRDNNFSYEPKTSGTDQKIQVVKYFDIEKKAFRACRIDRLIEVAA